MSTLRVASINHPSASSGGLALSSAGNVTGAGLDLITAQSFSAVSSVSVNNCFTSTYENYRIVLTSFNSVETPLLLRLRSAGADAATSYFSKLIYSRYDGTGVFGDAVRNNSDNLWLGTGAIQRGIVFDVHQPALAAATQFQVVTNDNNAAASGGGRHGTTSAYDGFTLYVTTGNVSGTIRAYGYRNG